MGQPVCAERWNELDLVEISDHVRDFAIDGGIDPFSKRRLYRDLVNTIRRFEGQTGRMVLP